MSVGQAYPHDTAELHVTGAARYVDDHSLPHNRCIWPLGFPVLLRV